MNGNRRQFLSDDRVTTTFPSANLSLRTITLFPAPVSRARFFNNLTWSGGANLSRSWVDRSQGPVYVPGEEDTANLQGGVNTSLNLGNLSVSGNLSYREGVTQGLRTPIVGDMSLQLEERGMLALEGRQGDAWLRLQETDPDPEFGDPFDASQADLEWISSVNYQQRLVGSVTLTPRVSFAGQYRRIDTLAVAQDFVSGPVRTAFGATLRGDIYGFFPGFGGFSRIRHKVSPSFTYDWAPEVMATELQSQVFGSRTSRPRNVVSVTLNQTFEAKRESDQDTVVAPPTAGGAPGEPTRLPQAQIVNLLSLRTSAIQYDFVEADDPGFRQGFPPTGRPSAGGWGSGAGTTKGRRTRRRATRTNGWPKRRSSPTVWIPSGSGTWTRAPSFPAPSRARRRAGVGEWGAGPRTSPTPSPGRARRVPGEARCSRPPSGSSRPRCGR